MRCTRGGSRNPPESLWIDSVNTTRLARRAPDRPSSSSTPLCDSPAVVSSTTEIGQGAGPSASDTRRRTRRAAAQADPARRAVPRISKPIDNQTIAASPAASASPAGDQRPVSASAASVSPCCGTSPNGQERRPLLRVGARPVADRAVGEPRRRRCVSAAVVSSMLRVVIERRGLRPIAGDWRAPPTIVAGPRRWASLPARPPRAARLDRVRARARHLETEQVRERLALGARACPSA